MLLWYWTDSFCGFLRLPVWLEHVGSFFKLLLYTINEFQLIHNYHKSADDLSSFPNPHSTDLSFPLPFFLLSTHLSIHLPIHLSIPPCFLIHPLQIHLFLFLLSPLAQCQQNRTEQEEQVEKMMLLFSVTVFLMVLLLLE